MTSRHGPHLPPHCAEADCGKCMARCRWLRRKAWRAQQSLIRCSRPRKEVVRR